MPKDPVWYAKPANGAPSILIGDDEYHARGRRVLSHAFSEKALSEQEPLIQSYADQLVDRLREVTSKTGEAQDMTKWYNWTTFDVIADLTFGEPFGCLQNLETHKFVTPAFLCIGPRVSTDLLSRYITLLFESLKGFRIGYIMHYYPWLRSVGRSFVPVDLLEKRKEFLAWVKSQVRKRMARDTQRPDFMTHILANNGIKGAALTNEQIDSNANTLLVAGSETTATLLSGVTYCLLANPDKHDELKREIRGRFKEYSDITLAAVNDCPYLIAVLTEALRYFPPVPAGFQRIVAAGGEVVSGYYVPEGTSVSVSHYPAYRSETNFKDPDHYVPERWLPDQPKYAGDKRAAFQPFSFGPRNCVGKNLAYAEMRLILAKIIWSFDLEPEAECADWMDRMKVITLWWKPPLMVRLTEVTR